MIRSRRKISLLVVLLLFMWGCEDEMTPLASYVPIEAQLWGLEFQGYDGYIVAGWEIHVIVIGLPGTSIAGII